MGYIDILRTLMPVIYLKLSCNKDINMISQTDNIIYFGYNCNSFTIHFDIEHINLHRFTYETMRRVSLIIQYDDLDVDDLINNKIINNKI